MKLEQAIQRSKKSHNRIIGQTSNEAYILEWELVYHEVLEICNVSELTEVKCSYSDVELPLHYELHGTINNIQINEAFAKVVWFITQQNKPYLLHHFTTGLSVPLDNGRQILGFLDTGLKRYKVFRQERFSILQKKLSENISKLGLPNFNVKKKKSPAAKKTLQYSKKS